MTINTNLINSALAGTNGTTFVSAKYESPINAKDLAKGFKDRNIVKRGYMHGIAFATVKDARNAYEQAVKRDLQKSGDADGAARFQTQSNWFEHGENDAFSIVRHRKNPDQAYLYILPRGGNGRYFDLDTGEELSREAMAALMIPSKAKALIDPPKKIENKTHGVSHSVQCRTTALTNIRRLRIAGHTLRG